jgi:hypothetical protein
LLIVHGAAFYHMLETLWTLEFSGAFSGRTDLQIEFVLGLILINVPFVST